MTKKLTGKLVHQELTEDTLKLPRFLRGGAFLYTVDKLFDGSRHVDHWRNDCINVLIEEWQMENLQGRGKEYAETMAYLHTYERIVNGLVPKSYCYGKTRN